MVCVVLGRGADDAKVDHRLRAGRPGGRLRGLRVDARSGGTRSRLMWTARSTDRRSPADRRELPASSRSRVPKARPRSVTRWAPKPRGPAEIECLRGGDLARAPAPRILRRAADSALASATPSGATGAADLLRDARPDAGPDRGDRHRGHVPHAHLAQLILTPLRTPARAAQRPLSPGRGWVVNIRRAPSAGLPSPCWRWISR